MQANNILSEKYFFHHDDKQIEFIKNELRSSESFILKTETNTSKSSSKAAKIVKVSTPVLSLGLSVLTVFNFGFSFVSSGIMDKIQFALVSLLFAGIYLVPVAIALVILAALISTLIDGRKNMTKKSSYFVEISQEIQEYIKFFDPEKINKYTAIQSEIVDKEEDLKRFKSLVKKAKKDFALKNEAVERIEQLDKEIELLNDMADSVLRSEMQRVIDEDDKRKTREEIKNQIEVERLIYLSEEKKKRDESEIESKILFELANDSKDISQRSTI